MKKVFVFQSHRRYITIKKVFLCHVMAFPMMLFSQNAYRSPVDFPIGLSATFGEPRTNHYHSGLDIRTQQVTGKKVYAIADGYVSRISVSPSGYGKAIYITHADGITSVYGHLFSFNEKIAKYVVSMQYQQESFAVNLMLDPLQLPVRKGEVIALSGNSGSSGGPHLHFELRDTQTENPLNPQAFGFKVEDKIAPELSAVRLIPKTDGTMIQGIHNALNLALTGSNGRYKIVGKDTINVAGIVSFGIEAKDKSTGSTTGNGVYSIEMLIDKKTVFRQKMDRLNFDDTRSVNSAIDYAEYYKTKKKYQTTEIQPGNSANIYEISESNGKFSFENNRVYEIKYVVSDFAGNTTTVSFHVKGVSLGKPEKSHENNMDILHITWNEPFEYSEDGMRFFGDVEVFFDNVSLKHSKKNEGTNLALSPVYQIGDPTIPMKHAAVLALKPFTAALKQHDSTKLVVVLVNEKGKLAAQESSFKDGFVVANVRELGQFKVMVDDVIPTITPLNISEKKNIATQKSIKIKITDNLSGIKSYTGRLNGKWILMDYDRKNQLLEYVFDDRMKKGVNVFTLEVLDYADNVNTLTMNLIY